MLKGIILELITKKAKSYGSIDIGQNEDYFKLCTHILPFGEFHKVKSETILSCNGCWE